MPSIVENCLSQMTGERRKRMMSICRNALDVIEEKMVSGSYIQA
jgi:hypothetical protein